MENGFVHFLQTRIWTIDVAVGKHCICYGFLGEKYAIKDCKVNMSGILRCNKKHNGFLHSEDKMVDEKITLNISDVWRFFR